MTKNQLDNQETELDSSQENKTFESLSMRDKRSLVFHLLYIAESYDYGISIDDIVNNVNAGFEFDIPVDSDVVQTAAEIIKHRIELDEEYKPFLTNWRFDRLGICTKLILRYAVWEILYSTTEHSIIINEAIELAKCFAEKDAYKFINGILDEIIKKKNQK